VKPRDIFWHANGPRLVRKSVEAANLSFPSIRWMSKRRATTLLNQAMSRLREECVASRKGDLFGKVESFLSGGKAKI